MDESRARGFQEGHEEPIRTCRASPAILTCDDGNIARPPFYRQNPDERRACEDQKHDAWIRTILVSALQIYPRTSWYQASPSIAATRGSQRTAIAHKRSAISRFSNQAGNSPSWAIKRR